MLDESINETIPSFSIELNNHDFINETDLELLNFEDDDEIKDKPTTSEFFTLLNQHEDRPLSILEEIEEVNLRMDEESKCVWIGTSLSPNARQTLIDFWKEYVDIFTWSYANMSGLDTRIVVYHLPVKPGAKSVKQKLLRLRPEWILKIREEIIK